MPGIKKEEDNSRESEISMMQSPSHPAGFHRANDLIYERKQYYIFVSFSLSLSNGQQVGKKKEVYFVLMSQWNSREVVFLRSVCIGARFHHDFM